MMTNEQILEILQEILDERKELLGYLKSQIVERMRERLEEKE